ncbi:MAG: 16S rRNA (uracil(1498)-N(3))-methyltransferase [Bacteroidota bacterium]
MQLFYNSTLTEKLHEFFFSAEESKHILRVLRKKEGETLFITNGKGFLFEAEILVTDLRKCKARIISAKKSIPKRHKLHLVVAPTKMNDRYEWFLEKATEIGVNEITPIICDHSERKTIKVERMERVMQSAMKQSLQTFLPKLNPIISYQEFMNSKLNGFKFIAHCDEGEKMEFKRKAVADSNIIVLIGPEGDFSKTEIGLAKSKGFVPVSLGANRLRTETAAIVACTIVSMVNS